MVVQSPSAHKIVTMEHVKLLILVSVINGIMRGEMAVLVVESLCFRNLMAIRN